MSTKTVLGLICMSTVLNASGASLADYASAAGNALLDSSKVVDLDEVIIVSQPKENFRLRHMPVGSNVFTSTEMQRLDINDISRLSAYVPSLAVPAYGSRLTSTMYVRGLGSRSGNPAMGVYVDNVPLVNKTTFNRHFYQLDRIDVIRGAQGTLYGMNTEGGIMRIYTKNPMNYQGTDIKLGIGTGLYSNAEIAQYHRPTDKFAFSTAFFYNGQKGFFKNTNLGERADLSNEAGGRLRMVYAPTSKLTFDFGTEYQYVNQNAFAYGEYDNLTGNFSDPATTLTNGYKRQMVNGGLTISYHTPRFLLSSTTGYQFLSDLMLMDQDYLPADYMRLEQMQKMNAITQEITLRTTDAGCWRHTSGAFFSNEWLGTEAPVYFGEDMNSMIISNFTAMGMKPNMLKYMTITDNYVPGKFKTPVLNAGVFHESNISFFNRLTATVGLRYDYQRVKIDYNTRALFALTMAMPDRPAMGGQYVSALSNSSAKSYHQLLPKIALTYRFDNNGNNVYALVSKGFRAGGYNLQMFSDIFQTELQAQGKNLMALAKGDYNVPHTDRDYNNINNTIAYEPETSWNYEAGAHLNLFGGKVHADMAAFLMHISNQQLSVMAGDYGYGRMMVNAGRSRSVGAEVSLRGKAAADRFSWAATYGFVNSTFRKYTDNVTVYTQEGNTDDVEKNYRGNKVPFVPEHTFSAVADYRFDLDAASIIKSITLGADVTGNGNIYWDVDNKYTQDVYAQLGAHVSLDFGKATVNLWGRNITNTRYNVFLINSSVDRTLRSFAQRGNPKQYGIDLSVHL